MIEILLMTWVLLIAFGIGNYILCRSFNNISLLESFVFSTALGFGVIAYLTYFLGLLGLFYSHFAYAILVILSILAFPKIKNFVLNISRQQRNTRNSSSSLFSIIIGCIILLHISVNLIGDLTPPLNGDTLATYLHVPKIWVNNHKIVEIKHHLFSYMPGTAQMLSSLGILLKSDILSQLMVGFLMSILACLAVYTFSRNKFSQDISLLASGIFYCSLVINWLANSAKLDLLWTFFDLMAIFAFFKHCEDGEIESKKWIYLSAIFCGFSLGTKYTAYSFAIIVLAIFFQIIKKYKRITISNLKVLFDFIGISLIVASPWYIKNIILTGNPVFPLFSELNMNLLLQECRGILGYFKVFWVMSTHESMAASSSAGPIYIAFIPWLIFFNKVDRRIKFMLIFVLGFSFLWYTQLQRTRHFLPAIALLSIVAAYSIYRLKDQKKFLSVAINLLLISLFTFNLGMGIWDNIIHLNKFSFIFGKESRDQFLSRVLTGENFPTHENYKIVKFINANLEDSSKILIISSGHGYYVDRIMISDQHILNARSENEILTLAKNKGFTHLLIKYIENDFVFSRFSGHKIIMSKEFIGKYLHLEFFHGNQSIFKINYPDVSE